MYLCHFCVFFALLSICFLIMGGGGSNLFSITFGYSFTPIKINRYFEIVAVSCRVTNF